MQNAMNAFKYHQERVKDSAAVHGVTKSDMTEQLNNHCIHTSLLLCKTEQKRASFFSFEGALLPGESYFISLHLNSTLNIVGNSISLTL